MVLVVFAMSACTAPSPSPSPTMEHTPLPTTTPEPSLSPEGTPTPPLSLDLPDTRDLRLVQVTVVPQVAPGESGQLVVAITNLDSTRIEEIVLRWATALGTQLWLAPFAPSEDRTCNTCPPLRQEWTKWVEGPGEQGEPAGTTSLGWGPIDPGATLVIPLVATRRYPAPVAFDLQVLEGESILTLRDGGPAEVRVAVP